MSAKIFRNALVALLVVASIGLFFERSYLRNNASEQVKGKCAAESWRSFKKYAYTDCIRRN